MVLKDNSFYVFGGFDGNLYPNYAKRISKFDMSTLRWSVLGSLNIGRSGHNVIEVDDQFLVIGGEYDSGNCCFVSEKCRFWRGRVICTTQEPTVEYFGFKVELFLVPDNFGKYDYC